MSARRIVFALVLFAMSWFVPVGEAHAQAPTNTCPLYGAMNDRCSREEAWALCNATASYYNSDPVWQAGSVSCTHVLKLGPQLQPGYSCSGKRKSDGAGIACGYFYYNANQQCPAGKEWNEVLGRCETGCSAREPLGSHSARGSMTVCSDGCQFEQGAGICIGAGTTAYCYAREWTPTGNACTAGDAVPNPHDPLQDTCRSTGGGWNECIKENGDHCVTGAKGTRMCWTPGETGTKNDGSGQEWANRQPPGQPTPPPPNIENPTQETTTADKGGVSGQGVGGTFVVSGGSGTGNSGGQHNTGKGGSGSGSGSGKGDGDGDSDTGTPSPVGSDLYERTDKTVGGVFASYRARIEGAPIFAAATGFFSAPSGGGSCPVWTVPANEYLPAMTFDFFCSSALQQLMTMAGWLILAIASYKAFHIAIGD